MYKSIEIKEFCVYWQNETEELDVGVAGAVDRIINEIDCLILIYLNNNERQPDHKYRIKTKINNMNLNVKKSQIKAILNLIEDIEIWQKRNKYWRFKSQATNLTPIQLWKFAKDNIIQVCFFII